MDIIRKGKEVWKRIEGVGKFPSEEDHDMYKEGIEHLTAEKTDWSRIEHFKPKEFSCKCGKCLVSDLVISFDLVLRLDALRKLFNGVIRINSGYRCDEHPETLKNPMSSHNLGEAVDIAAKTSALRFRLLQLIFNNHLFTRIGMGKDYLHLDIDEDKPQDLVWDYYHIKQ